MIRNAFICLALLTVGADPAPPRTSPVTAPIEIKLVAGGMPQVVTVDNPGKLPVAVVNTTTTQLGFWQIVSPSPGKLAFLAFSQSPGTYEVCFLVNGKSAEEPPAETARTRIVVEGVVPTPPGPTPPGPTPKPEPPAPPVQQKLYLVVVEETSEATARRTAFMLDPALRSHFALKGHAYRLVEKDIRDGSGNVPADVKTYLAEAAGKSLPYLIVVPQAGGRSVYSGPVPESPAKLIELLGKVGG